MEEWKARAGARRSQLMIPMALSELESLVTAVLHSRDLSDRASQLIASDLIGAEIEGKRTHGLARLLLLDDQLAAREGEPRVVQQSGAVTRVDGRRELGQLVGGFAVDQAIRAASIHGIGCTVATNAGRYGRLAFFGQMIAEHGFVGLLMNQAGPAVVPYGGIDPILGTNPICFAFPGDPALVIDFATSAQPWRAIAHAIDSGNPLPDDAFLTQDGDITTDPTQAKSILPFGGAKGYALGVAVELLCGGLLTGIVGTSIASEYELGCLFVAIDPDRFGPPGRLEAAVSDLRQQITTSRKSPLVPGDGSRARAQSARERGLVDVNAGVLAGIRHMAEGKRGRSGRAGSSR